MIYQGTFDPNGKPFYLETGLYESPCGTFWSSNPITREQKAYEIMWRFCWRHKITFGQLKQQIDSGKRTGLPKWVRKYLIENYN